MALPFTRLVAVRYRDQHGPCTPCFCPPTPADVADHLLTLTLDPDRIAALADAIVRRGPLAVAILTRLHARASKTLQPQHESQKGSKT